MTGRNGSGHDEANRGPDAERTSGSGEPTGRDDRVAGGTGGPVASDDDGLFDDEPLEVTTEIIDGNAPESDAVALAFAQRDEYLDSLRRLQAEFENYKKRVIKQQADQTARAAVSLLEKILPVLDTFDLAIEHMGDPGSVDGRALDAVYSQLRDVLTKEGLERISPIGERFDPNTHEAVGHLPAEVDPEANEGGSSPSAPNGDEAEDDEPVVAQVMRPGYRWRGAVLRPAMVVVRG
jgi:molecular chaperone GrpE